MSSEKNRAIIANYEEQARVSPFDMLSTGRYLSSVFGYGNRLGRFLCAEMELRPTDRVLDAGCNVGIYHRPMARRVKTLIGVDASQTAIARARARNADLANTAYQVADLLALKPSDFPHKFDKILCYSVAHFLGDLQEFEALVRVLSSLLEDGRGLVFLGEMREKELYDSFKNRHGSSLRDVKFAALKVAWRWMFRSAKLKEGIPPTLFSRAEIEATIAKAGGRAERIPEASWHPFYNTCADYRIRF